MNLLTAQFSSAALGSARRTYNEGLQRPGPRIPNMEKRQSARYVADLSRRVSKADMEALNEATQLREQALTLARTSQTGKARGLLDEATSLVADRVESREGQISAASFHGAAAGFVEHVDARHEAAMRDMLSALQHCRTLSVEFGHSVAMRRVHLARNLARLIWSLGEHARAIELCDALLAYTWIDEALWPLQKDTRIDPEPKASLRRDERVFLTDQLMSEIVSTCAHARLRREPFRFDTEGVWEASGDDFPERAHTVRWFCASFVGSDLDQLLSAAAAYFEAGPVDLPMTWGRITRLVEAETGERLALV